MNTLIVILGPTGVGKSAVSLQLAQHYSTDIISADSRQLFRELSIGTAVPPAEDLQAITHHFIQTHSIHQYYNVSEYETQAISKINELFKTKNPLILTGGSMMYIDTICKGIDDIPTITPETRKEVTEWYHENGLEALQHRLLSLDSDYYKIADLNNPKRLLHAVEVCQQTGKTFTSFRTNTLRIRPFRILKIGINQQREVLYQRINQRVEQMMEAGLLEEARGVYPYKGLNSLNTVSYKELFTYFDGAVSLDEAIDLIKRNSRKYARKQLTWFRRDTEIHWFEPQQVNEMKDFIDEQLYEGMV